MAAHTTALEDAIRRQEEAVADALSRSGWLFWKTDPEVVKVLGVIHAHLGEIRRLHLLRPGERHYDVSAVDYRVKELLRRDVSALNISSGWEYAEALYRLLLVIGDHHYVFAHLSYEFRRLCLPSDSNYGYLVQFFDKDKITAVLKAYDDGKVSVNGWQHRRAVEYLTILSSSINDLGRHNVAGRELRTQYLNRLTLVLALVLLLSLTAIYLVCGGPAKHPLNFREFLRLAWAGGLAFDLSQPAFGHAIVSGALGALGGVLSGFYKLRDEVSKLDDLRSFRSAMWAQPFVGAVIGVFLSVVITVGVLGVQLGSERGSSWATFAVLAFIAGFSEPFFLGVVSRVAGSADKAEEKKKKQAGAAATEGAA